MPFARSIHERGVLLDKAAVLKYARIISRDGRWVSCECCFTIVHDVLVACTSIYRRGEKSNSEFNVSYCTNHRLNPRLTRDAGRALEAPQIRRLFACSPKDPRYHMLEHLSPKFRTAPTEREPRAALIVNRFTRTLTVMFATEAVGSILGVSAEHVKDKSFYECIQERSLDDAFKCLESAKANDSIAYLRFWSRDPRRPEDFTDEESDSDGDDDDVGDQEAALQGNAVDGHQHGGRGADEESGFPATQPGNAQLAEMPYVPPSRRSTDSEEGGVKLDGHMDVDEAQQSRPSIKVESNVGIQDGLHSHDESSLESRGASSLAMASSSHATAYESPPTPQSQRSANGTSPDPERQRSRAGRRLAPSVELEAVVSCTSDGLVVILRRARPQFPGVHPPLVPVNTDNGIFAAPWSQQPIHPHHGAANLHNFRAPPLGRHMPLREGFMASSGPPMDHLMQSIRDVAVFAWAVCGINGNLASYGQGRPMGEAQPPDGLPIWDPDAARTSYLGPHNQAVQRWTAMREEQQSIPGMHTGLYLGDYAAERSMNHGPRNYVRGHENPRSLQPSSFHDYRNHESFAQNRHQSGQQNPQQMAPYQQMQFFSNPSQTERDGGHNANSHREPEEQSDNFYRWN